MIQVIKKAKSVVNHLSSDFDFGPVIELQSTTSLSFNVWVSHHISINLTEMVKTLSHFCNKLGYKLSTLFFFFKNIVFCIVNFLQRVRKLNFSQTQKVVKIFEFPSSLRKVVPAPTLKYKNLIDPLLLEDKMLQLIKYKENLIANVWVKVKLSQL